MRKPDYEGAIELLFESARELLKVGERGSGSDLALYQRLVLYNERGSSRADVSIERICQLISLTGPEGTRRKPLINKSLA